MATTAPALDERTAGAGDRGVPARRPRRRLRLGLFALAIALGVAAAAVRPYDERVSAVLRVPRADRSTSLLWHAVQPVKLFGKGEVLGLLAVAIALYGHKRMAFSACLAMALAGGIAGPAKLAFERQRPDGRDARSFPSGDSAAATAFVIPLAAALPATRPVAAVVVGAIGLARIYVGRHFPSDVLGGAAVGALAAAIVLPFGAASRRWTRRLFRRRSVVVVVAALFAIRLFTDNERNLAQFLAMFGPAAAVAAAAPLLRARARARAGEVGARAAVLLAVAIAGFLLFATTRSTLWDRDEPRFAEATVEMLRSRDWIVPTFNGALRPDKPILIYWLMSLPVRIFGPTELASRFFAPLGAALACLFTWRIGRRILTPGADLRAMAVLASAPLLLVTGTAATTDAVLLAAITGALAAFEAAFDAGPRPAPTAALGVAIGLALLVKGPVGLAAPVLSAIAALVLARRMSRAWAAHLAAACAIGLGMALAWAIPANEATGGEFLRQGLGYHVLERAVRPNDGHGGNWLLFLPFYVPVVLVAFFPWTLFLPGALSAAAGARLGGERGRALLLGWIGPTFLLMSLVSTKLPHYVLPIFPALALAVAGTIEAGERGGLAARDLAWLARGRWLAGALGLAGGAGLAVAPWFVRALALAPPDVPGSVPLAWPCAALGLVILVTTALALREHAAGRLRSAFAVLAAGSVALGLSVVLLALPVVERFKVSKPLADAIRARTAGDVPVAELDYGEPSLIFYLGRRVASLESDAEVRRWADEPGPGVLVLARESRARIEAAGARLGLEEIAAARGFNYTKGKWVDLVALGRRLR
jgi:4-amino-4-deoxy-L-arabinose transferase-like glycosyltransferase/membrane-associated phospholipid phosphatase